MKVFNFFVKIVKIFYVRLILLTLTLLVAGFLSAYPIVYIKKIIDTAVQGESVKIIIYFGVIYFLLHILNALFSRLFEYYSNFLGNEISHYLRCKLFKHIQGIPISYFDDKSKTTFLFHFVEDNSITASTFLQPIAFVGRSIVTFIFGFYYMWNIDYVITLILLPIGFIVTGTVLLTGKEIEKREKYLISTKENLWQLFSNFIHGIKEIKGNCKEEYTLKCINTNSSEFKNADNKAIAFQTFSQGINQFFFMGIIAFIMVYGAVRVKLGLLSIGGLSAIMMYNGLLVDPLIELFSLYQKMKAQFVNIKRIQSIFDIKTEECFSGKEHFSFNKEIKFENVSFVYPTITKKVLDNINFIIRKGEKIALIGRSGQGKTTIIKLLSKFYEPTSGKIYIDDKPLNLYSVSSLRRKIAIVYQDFFLFKGTILDNIIFGDNIYSDEEINRAIEIAGLGETINRLPNGLNTYIGEDGVKLSSGEKQRVGIARAVLRNPEILILDEAVSNLDSCITKDILGNIKNFFKNKTVIFIIHKLTFITDFPRIILVENGHIVGDGTHSELMVENLLYREIYQSQFRTFEKHESAK